MWIMLGTYGIMDGGSGVKGCIQKKKNSKKSEISKIVTYLSQLLSFKLSSSSLLLQNEINHFLNKFDIFWYFSTYISLSDNCHVKICKFTALSSGSLCQVYRVTDEA